MPTATAAQPDTNAHTLQCFEVWGGNHAVDNGVAMPGLDAWVYSEPYEHATGGGDVHYVSSCATGRITRILLMDVAGHGEGAATLAVRLRDLMRRYVNYSKQTDFVNALNREFFRRSEGYRFATGIAATFWGPTNTLSLSIAGHPLPLHYRAKAKQWSLLSPGDSGSDARNLPLGVDEDAAYDEFSVKLGVGDIVLMYSDALIETDNGEGQLLGEGGLLDVAKTLDPTDPSALITRLREVINPEIDRQTDQDDVTLLALRCNGNAPKGSPLLGMLGGWRVVRESARSLFKGERMPLPEFTVPTIFGAFSKKLSKRGG
ncbi:unnamed protein product [Symbiodinium necroappetens]|uniref:PPM-type phosphatase domain-containing protein n=1 Tax=Symbiodinium necroappetens TaxID=1628268 RepID=A0A812VSS3_9DINO|nr:unnamed protein product [Symbiodinium necroappetens]